MRSSLPARRASPDRPDVSATPPDRTARGEYSSVRRPGRQIPDLDDPGQDDFITVAQVLGGLTVRAARCARRRAPSQRRSSGFLLVESALAHRRSSDPGQPGTCASNYGRARGTNITDADHLLSKRPGPTNDSARTVRQTSSERPTHRHPHRDLMRSTIEAVHAGTNRLK